MMLATHYGTSSEAPPSHIFAESPQLKPGGSDSATVPSQSANSRSPPHLSLLAINESCPEDDDEEVPQEHENQRRTEAPVDKDRPPLWGTRPVPHDVMLVKVKKEPEDTMDETSAAPTLVMKSSSVPAPSPMDSFISSFSYTSPSLATSASSTTMPTKFSSVDAKKKRSIERFWRGVCDQYGTSLSTEGEGSDDALFEIMHILACYVSNQLSIQDTFSSLLALFRNNNCEYLYGDFLGLLLQQDVNKEFLLSKGIDLSLLNTRSKLEEEYKQELLDGSENETDDEDDVADSSAKRARLELKRKNGAKAGRSLSQQDSMKESEEDADERNDSSRQRSSPDKWTPEEDEKLIALVEKYGVETKRWRQIAEELGTTKNSAKCAQHWRRVLAPNIHKGSWSVEEEKKLLAGIQRFGLCQWTMVSRDIPGRTDIQCRYHYIRQLNSRKMPWTSEEENMLFDLVNVYGDQNAWVKISEKLAQNKIRRTPRTALECLEHWQLMQAGNHDTESGKDSSKRKRQV